MNKCPMPVATFMVLSNLLLALFVTFHVQSRSVSGRHCNFFFFFFFFFLLTTYGSTYLCFLMKRLHIIANFPTCLFWSYRHMPVSNAYGFKKEQFLGLALLCIPALSTNSFCQVKLMFPQNVKEEGRTFTTPWACNTWQDVKLFHLIWVLV